MKRTLAAASIALVLSVSLAGCITVNLPADPAQPAPGVTLGGDDDARTTIACTDGTALVNQAGTDYLVTGNCDTVTIEGKDIDVHIESTASLVVRGDGNDVEVAKLGNVLINGQDNDIEVTETLTVDKVEIAGNQNDVSTQGTITAVVLNGNNNAIEYVGEIATISDNGSNNTTELNQ
jgi:hypothetical protein